MQMELFKVNSAFHQWFCASIEDLDNPGYNDVDGDLEFHVRLEQEIKAEGLK